MPSSQAASSALKRTLILSARLAGVAIMIEEDDWTRWASAVFAGTQHLVKVSAAPSAAFDLWISRLAELELDHDDYLMVVLTVRAKLCTGHRTEVHIEAMTVEVA